MDLGIFSVIGRNLVPSPPARINAWLILSIYTTFWLVNLFVSLISQPNNNYVLDSYSSYLKAFS
jgi:hypothetical protein